MEKKKKNQISQLKDRVFSKKGKYEETELTNVLDLIREFSCLGEILGRDFEVKNSKGKVVYTIHQKPIAMKQVNILLKEFAILKGIDAEREAAKWGANKKGIPKLKR